MVALVSLVLLLWEPDALVSDITLGVPFVPVTGESRWLTPLTLVAVLCAVALVVRCLVAERPLVDLRDWAGSFRRADPLGAALMALALAGVILAFASADPAVQVMSPVGGWLLAGSALATAALVWHLRRATKPLIPRHALRERPAWGSLLVSFFVGASLIAALVDIPVYARLTTYKTSQLMAALVLLRLLVAIPVGAVAGGFLTRRLPAGVVCAGRHGARDGRLRVDDALGGALAGEPADQHPAACSRGSASGWRWHRSTPPCSPAPRRPCTAW